MLYKLRCTEENWLLGFLFTLVVVPFSAETAQALQYSVIWGFWEDLGGGQNPSWSFPPISRSPAEFPQCAPAQHRMGSAGVGHVEKVIILCQHGRRSTGQLESTAGWGQQQFIGLENYVGFTFYTPVNSDFHEVGGVATATVVSHHFCCLCHKDHLILS